MRRSLSVFFIGAGAGGASLLFNFWLRLAQLAPYAPETVLEKFLTVIPESIQEPAVQNLGDYAGKLGLVVASLVGMAIFGVLALGFYQVYSKVDRPRNMNTFELSLLYSLVPWVLFGLVIFPIFGASIFGLHSDFASSTSFVVFPVSLLFAGFLFSSVMYFGLEKTKLVRSNVRVTVYRTKKSKAVPSIQGAGDISRRVFLEKAIVVGGVTLLALTSLDKIVSSLGSASRNSSTNSMGAIDLQAAPAIFSDPRLASLVDNEVTPNGSFYRVAIDIIDPSVDSSSWSLQVGGSVNSPKTYSLSSLQNSFQAVEQYNTFECVSNLINGNLISNAKWTGLRIADLLNAVGVGQDAQYVVFYSVDGYSVAIPLSKAMMSDSILAYMMNGESLPQAHGYPLRAVIPGLYGMMSAKFLNKIEVVNSAYEGYWQTRGWSNVGQVQTVSFITIPGNGGQVSLSQYNGSVIIAGRAYGGDRGISKVEVSVDGGNTWQTAELKSPLSDLTWELWAYEWKPTSTGTYNVYARATDGTGATQTSTVTDTFPNGATGYAMITMNVNS